MANTITLEAELRTKLDQSQATAEVEKLQRTVDQISLDKSFNVFAKKYEKLANMKIKGFEDFQKQQQGLEQLEQVFGESRTKEFKSAISQGAQPKGSMMESVMGSLGKGMQGLLSIGTKIFAGVGIAVAIMKVFQPAANMLNVITKLLAEFFRPIGVMFQVLLQPVLQLLRPILMVFRTAMQPFMQAALQLSREATRDMIQGLEGTGIIKSLLAVDTILIGLEYAIVKGTWQTTKLLVDVLYSLQKTLIKVITVIGSSIVGGLGLLINKTAPGNPGNPLIGAAGSIAATSGIVSAGIEAQRNNFFKLGDALIDKFFDAAGNSIEDAAASLGSDIDIPDKLGLTWKEVMGTFVDSSSEITYEMFGRIEEAWSEGFQTQFIDKVDGNFFKLFSELGNTFDTAYEESKTAFEEIIDRYWSDLADANMKAMQESLKQTITLKTDNIMEDTMKSIGGRLGPGSEKFVRGAAANDDKDALLQFLGIGAPTDTQLKSQANSEVYEKLASFGYNSLAEATLANLAEGGKVYNAYSEGFNFLQDKTTEHFQVQTQSWESMYGPNGTIAMTTKRGASAQMKSMDNVNKAAQLNVTITSKALSNVVSMSNKLDKAYKRIDDLEDRRSRRGR